MDLILCWDPLRNNCWISGWLIWNAGATFEGSSSLFDVTASLGRLFCKYNYECRMHDVYLYMQENKHNSRIYYQVNMYDIGSHISCHKNTSFWNYKLMDMFFLFFISTVLLRIPTPVQLMTGIEGFKYHQKSSVFGTTKMNLTENGAHYAILTYKKRRI